ncbi:MAG: hypothetical protein QM608_09060 [Caulobacter sp.]
MTDYRDWLRSQAYDEGTIAAQLYRVARIEQHYGPLDGHYRQDGLTSLVEQLSYSTEDKRLDRPNPSRIPFVGDIRNNLASYKSAVLWYRRYKNNQDAPGDQPAPALDARPKVRTAGPKARPHDSIRPERRRTLVDFGLDGQAALEAVIAGSQYRTIAQAVASLTLFSHPATVRQTQCKALFPTIRNQKRVGQYDLHEGRMVLLDDNKSPTDAFLWANGINRRGPDTQFNHVYANSLDMDAYTALPNLCMTPAFIAKLTDTNEHVRALLCYRSHQLYGWLPKGATPPEKPEEYEILEWAAPLPPVADVRATMERAMASKPKSRTVIAARRLGWLFA